VGVNLLLRALYHPLAKQRKSGPSILHVFDEFERLSRISCARKLIEEIGLDEGLPGEL
jgi:hypothetical protein